MNGLLRGLYSAELQSVKTFLLRFTVNLLSPRKPSTGCARQGSIVWPVADNKHVSGFPPGGGFPGGASRGAHAGRRKSEESLKPLAGL